MHWVLDVEFKDDLARYRSGHGAKNMAVVRRFALGLPYAPTNRTEASKRAANQRLGLHNSSSKSCR